MKEDEQKQDDSEDADHSSCFQERRPAWRGLTGRPARGARAVRVRRSASGWANMLSESRLVENRLSKAKARTCGSRSGRMAPDSILALEVSGEQIQVGAGASQDGLAELGDGAASRQGRTPRLSRRARVSAAGRAARVCRSEA